MDKNINKLKINKPELLAPCGDFECFLSAVNNGADAVYLSGDKFGARAYAKNFSSDELIDAIDYAHLFGIKVYLTINTLIKDSETSEIYDYLLPLYNAGLDGVIVQDIGCISYIMEKFPMLPVHGSTQMAITGASGVDLLKNIGLTRVVLARELSMKEIDTIYNETHIELECFIHGALCYSYSGKCLFSSLVGGRSGNRGRCAGPCRQPYNNDEYLLSTKDICCLKLIPNLCNGSIASFKIEGRMKSPEYVAGVTAIYRKHIDRYFELLKKYGADKAKELYLNDKSLEHDYNTLVSLYTRGGNSEGYYYKHNGKDMISIKDASYKSSKDFDLYDDKNDISNVKKIKVSAYASFYKGNEAMLSLSTKQHSVCVSTGLVLESNNRALDYETVKKQLCKTGNTAFLIDDLICDIEDNSYLKISELNELRRLSIEALKNEILSEFRRNINDISVNNKNTSLETKEIYNSDYENKADEFGNITDARKKYISADIIDKKHIDAVINNPTIDAIYVPFNILRDNTGVIDKIKNKEKLLYLKFPSVIRNDFFDVNISVLNSIISNVDGALIDNYETLKFLKDIKFSGEYLGDIHMYAPNKYAKEAYKRIGLNRITVPVELNRKEILSADYSNDELIVYGRLPMMISAQCVHSTLNGCDHKPMLHSIKDRTRAEFLCINDCSVCNNTIYNGSPLSLHGEEDYIRKVNAAGLRFIFTDEAVEDINGIINCVINDDKMSDKYIKKFTRGHLNRGVL